MKRGTKIALGIVGAAAAGGAVGYLVARTRTGLSAIQSAEDVIGQSGLRLPQPGFAVEVAYDEGQFEVLDDLVCECGEPIVQGVTPDADLDEVVAEIQDCMAQKLYPQFPWPPVSGDHPSVSQLWSELGLIARKALVMAEICPTETNPGAVAPW